MDATATAKKIDIGAEVIGSDGKKLGKVSYVVVRPDEKRVAEIVVSTGAILGRDVVVPLSLIDDVRDGKVYLSINKNELDKYPDYIEVDYENPPPEWVPPEGMTYAGILWPAGAYYPVASSVHVNAPPGSLGICEGMDVESSDGHKVGSVEAIDIDMATGEVRGFVVKRGFLFTHDVRIPAGDVQMIRDGKVILNLTKDQVQLV
jgi:sporulation protein YlmC with PRC-barrel domain